MVWKLNFLRPNSALVQVRDTPLAALQLQIATTILYFDNWTGQEDFEPNTAVPELAEALKHLLPTIAKHSASSSHSVHVDPVTETGTRICGMGA